MRHPLTPGFVGILRLKWMLSGLLVALLSAPLLAQPFLLKGKVLDLTGGQPLGDVSIVDMRTGTGVTTDQSGDFSLKAPPGQLHLEFSRLGYRTVDTVIRVTRDTALTIYLQSRRFAVDELVVTGEHKPGLVSSPEMGSFTLSSQEMSRLPSLLGETDPLKLIQLTPGIQTSSTGGSGFYVRGGGVDQNLILYDRTIVYNPGHLLGLFSVFNSDLVDNVTIHKSGIPARYGGKLSSVISVTTNKGNRDSLQVKGSAGIIFSKLSVSGPLLKGKGAFIAGARRTYAGLVVRPVLSALSSATSFLNKDNVYNFHDLNAGFSLDLSEADHLSFSAYYGRDNYRLIQEGLSQDNALNWGNRLASLTWKHRFSDRAGLTSVVSWTSYDFDFSGMQGDYSFGLVSAMEDFSVKSELNLVHDRHSVSAGFELTEHHFNPSSIFAQTGNFDLNIARAPSARALEGGLFFSDIFKISPALTLTGGVRLSFYNHHGPYQTFERDALGVITDTLQWTGPESLAFYLHPEPRLTLKYQADRHSSWKASYMRIVQYVHLATSTSASLPLDIWISSTESTLPMTGDQVSLGYYRSARNKTLEFSAEVYYKQMFNKPEFLRGIVYSSLDGDLESNIVQGFARSYGLECYVSGDFGKTSGWISYTLSRTENRFEEIHGGLFYPAKYDRTHDLSLTLVRELNNRWDASASFVYLTGNAFTMPVARYIIQGNVVNQYGDVNSFRMPANHRLDVSVKRKITSRRIPDSELVFSVYNVYNRANPFYIYYEVTGDVDKYSLKVEAFVVSLLPVIPSVSWNFNF